MAYCGSFAFVLAILTPNWLAFTTVASTGNSIVQRGIFYVCDLVASSSLYQTTRCVSLLEQNSSTDPNKWIYQFATACASLAIACAALSIIALWLSGLYFQVRRRTTSASCFLLSLSLLVLLIFCTSFIVWILLISETLRLGISIDRSIFNWPMWLAVGATGGYLLSFLFLLFSFCAKRRREDRIQENYRHSRNKF